VDCPSVGKRVRINYQEMLYKGWFFSEDDSLVSFTEEHQEFDPLQELEDSELVQGNSLLDDASYPSGTDVPSAGEALK